ncbi:MAG: helix-turn-helix domain-containing protein [Rhodanobacteraceae bacterium]|nr:helix-turn-helix domain-containing protein [Rhodanobacteraceae bacterium]
MAASNQVIDINELRQSCAGCALNALCLPAAIGGRDLARLDDIVKRRRPLARNDFLFREGDRHTSLFVVRQGAIKTSTMLPEGDTQVLGFHLPGEILGLDGVADERHRATAEALEEASVCEIPFAKLSEIAAQLPALQRQLYRIVSREFVREQQHPVMMGRKHALTRLALFLHSVSERRRNQDLEPHEFQLSMSRQDLASYLGLVIETVSRAFSRLQTQQIIDVDRRRVRILDAVALGQLANSEDTDLRAIA